MEPIFCGSCDLCKLDKKLLTIIQKPTVDALNHFFGLKISHPAIWRICAKCSYEVGHILMTFLKKITNNKHHPAMSPDLSKCNICGCNNIIKGFKMTKSIMEIRDTGLAVPLSGSGESFACLECIHLTDVVIEYKKMLMTSQIWLTSVQNLTDTINTAKRSSKPMKVRRNSETVKESRTDTGYVTDSEILCSRNQRGQRKRKCTKNDDFIYFSETELTSNVVSSRLRAKSLKKSPPKNLTETINAAKRSSKPTKVRRYSETVKESRTDTGYVTVSECLCSRNQRGQRKRKCTKNDDFIYFSKTEPTSNVVSLRLRAKSRKKSPPQPRALPKQPKTKNPLSVTKPRHVVLNRIQVMPLNKTPDLVREENVNPLSIDEEIFRGFDNNNNKRHTNDRQNENCPPNIPALNILMPPSDNSSVIPDFNAKPPKIVTNGFDTEPVFHELSSSSSTLSDDESTLNSSLLTTTKSVNKRVSFSDFDLVYYYTDEDTT